MTKLQQKQLKGIAYFSMEIGLEAALPTYSGGLGVLAGDTLRSFADQEMPVVGVSLLYRKGYFRQHIDAQGKQSESPVRWNLEDLLKPLAETVEVTIEGRKVKAKAWRYDIKGATGKILPVYFLDAEVAGNSDYDRTLTDSLYGGDDRYRLCQEILLGMGGVQLLDKLGYTPDENARADAQLGTYHMNEGHAALLTLALLHKRLAGKPIAQATTADVSWVTERCVFTTHTPVPAGHDRFSMQMAAEILGLQEIEGLKQLGACPNGDLNMTHLALRFSRYVNGVAKRHGEVSRQMFPEHPIAAITNGIHAYTWTSQPFRDLFDQKIPEWRKDNNFLRYAWDFTTVDIEQAHTAAKKILFDDLSQRMGVTLDPKVFTIGFARRAAEYKRGDMLFHDLNRLHALADKHGAIQVVFAGKSHPKDMGGKALIERIVTGASKLDKAKVNVVYVENYDMDLGAKITAAVDLWLNNPLKPLEASGTSGMKAAINGVPSLSTLDGWWVEGHQEGVTGWEIEDAADGMRDGDKDNLEMRSAAAKNMYDKLDNTILPMFYKKPDQYAAVMRASIAINGSFFNTQRMVQQYAWNAYS